MLIRGRNGMKTAIRKVSQISSQARVVVKWYSYLLLGVADVEANYLESDTNPVKGDLLAITGATLYAVYNVRRVMCYFCLFLQEFIMKTADQAELLAMLGLFGAIVGVSLSALSSCLFNVKIVVHCIIANVLLLYGLQWFDRSVLEREELKSIHWSSGAVDWMYFVEFAAVAVGLIVYST
ncbi:hypothetical protein R6Q57_017131 [Mikania cordata]